MVKRFRDERQTIYDFTDEFLVVCPNCRACAKVIPRDPGEPALFTPRRLVCSACAHIRDWASDAVRSADGVDWYFHLPLWLSTPCCGEVLWAHNWRHLQLVEDYVGALLREHIRPPGYGWSNRSLANRLPRWMKVAKNRAEVLEAITRLRQRG
ncbi:MAG: hypothetical protein K0Q72_1375 [Armatimonadetes bacterium]|jgi:hypothetical protein|nr:hypothetical protein [Armatimonadota bacterium]